MNPEGTVRAFNLYWDQIQNDKAEDGGKLG